MTPLRTLRGGILEGGGGGRIRGICISEIDAKKRKIYKKRVEKKMLIVKKRRKWIWWRDLGINMGRNRSTFKKIV